MKVLFRILIVLFASFVVVGSAIGISSVPSSSSSTDSAQSESNRPAPPEGFQRPDGEEGEGRNEGFSLMGLGSVGMELGKISLIVAPFAIAAGIQQRRKQNRKVTAVA